MKDCSSDSKPYIIEDIWIAVLHKNPFFLNILQIGLTYRKPMLYLPTSQKEVHSNGGRFKRRLPGAAALSSERKAGQR